MEWPALSPDLNPMENLWTILARPVYINVRQFENTEDLEMAIRHKWNAIHLNILFDLIESMKNRIFKIIFARGYHSRY
jgi:transposase